MCRTIRSSISLRFLLLAAVSFTASSLSAQPSPSFNRAPLAEKPYTELPLGAIKPEAWLLDELQRMAKGMTGHLDEWYPEVCGPRNAWLGGDGDTWERGPYWIDGLYPLARLLGNKTLEAKAQPWIEWTLAHQRDDGYIGPVELKEMHRTQPPPRGAQILKPDDWWPRMVMLKILQQHYMATGDPRVIKCLTSYFHYQLRTLPDAPLFDPKNPKSGSWWAAQRGGDNLMVVLWLYNITGERFLLDLGEIIHQQTVPVTDWFGPTNANMIRRRADQGEALHCVNLAQMMKTPVIRWQQDPQKKHLDSVSNAFADIRTFHGQPNGLYGGDEPMHGDAPDRGSELCSAVEMMFSLEKMFEITGNADFGDHLERIAFNALPTQTTDDHHGRQYFQQTNQIQCTIGDRDFFNDNGDRVVYGLATGYPCCTCNLHQGWPKFTQHLWLASKDGGLAAFAYAPSRVTAKVSGGNEVTLVQAGGYPFKETVTIDVTTNKPVEFPLHLRIPAWCSDATVSINGENQPAKPGTMHVIRRTWIFGDHVELHLPMELTASRWFQRSVAFERGPLVFALGLRETWTGTKGQGHGYRECTSDQPWNFGFPVAKNDHFDPSKSFAITVADTIPANPWTLESAPVRLAGKATRLPCWTLNRDSAAVPPLSPAPRPLNMKQEPIELIPYGATTLRITEFPLIGSARH